VNLGVAPGLSEPAIRCDGGEQLSPEQYAFVSYLFGAAGLDARAYRTETLRRRICACLRALGASSPRGARQALEQDPSLVPAAMSAMVIGVTSFFRDERVFDHLTYHVLPNLITAGKPLRIWSAGCSDGEELYSVAMLLAELQALDRAYLLGSDIRSEALARARAAAYEEAALKDVPSPWIEKYFTRDKSNRWRLAPSLVSAAHWRRGNLLAVHEPGPWDLILCRNMAMYVKPEYAGGLWNRLEDLLRPGGYLVLGKAERPIGATRLDAVAPCVYRRA